MSDQISAPTLPAAHPKEFREKAFALYKEGKPFVDIAYELKISAATLRSWCARDQWAKRREIVYVAPSLDAETATKLAKTVAKSAKEPVSADLAEQQERYQAGMGEVAMRVQEIARTMNDEDLVNKASKIKELDAIARKALKLEQDKPTTIIQIGLLNTPQARQTNSKQAALEADTIDV